VVFLTATIFSVQHWPVDAYLFVLATLGYGFALGGNHRFGALLGSSGSLLTSPA
jgi:hypothetical protein